MTDGRSVRVIGPLLNRVTKAPDVRRQEIISAAIKLFATEGYAATTVADIVEAVGVAKGTFYHYFPSKEAVMRAVINQVVEHGTTRAEELAADKTIPAADRFLAIIAAQRVEGDQAGLVDALHEADNTQLHVLSNLATIAGLTPILGQVVREGIDEGVFDVTFPEETVSILLAAASFLTEEGFDGYTPDMERLMPALLQAAERLFGAEKGTFISRANILNS